jgi:ubiquinone/menaquinone biosynthesis C-methylase UbiE
MGAGAIMNPLDPGPEVRAVWTEDSDFRRASAHYAGYTHVDTSTWGERVLERFGWSDGDLETGGYCDNISHADDDASGATWLEWGCGGGTVALAVQKLCAPDSYYAVDISADALAECMRRTNDRVTPLLASETASIPSGSVDYIVCTSVFQHFPSFEYARVVLAEMRRVLSPGGRGLISTRYFTPGDHYDPTALQRFAYRKAFARYCAWQVSEFWGELASAGFTPREVVLETETQHAWYRFGG